MKLLNKSLAYFSVSLFFILGIWSVVFYFNTLSEIKESVDEGLDNYKRQIIYSIQKDSTLLSKTNFKDSFYSIKQISKAKAITITDSYKDTSMYMQDADDKYPELEPVRMLTSAFEMSGNYYKLRIVSSVLEEDDLIKGLLWEMIGLYVVLMIVIVLINNIVLQKLWQPFYQLVSQLKKYQIGIDKQTPAIKTNTKEFVDLQKAVNLLIQHTEETFEQQKQFIGNASHELQTPLAIAINKLELLIEKGTLTDEQATNVLDIMQVLDRMVRLNKSLLLLSKIDNNQFLANEKVVLNDIVKQVIVDFEDFASYKAITVSFTEVDEVILTMDKSLATIIVTNLIKNAIVHNVENGSVHIVVSQKSLEISNSGLAVPMDNEVVFTRFYKWDNHSNGSGLGLAIVKAISERYRFKVDYHYTDKLHFFTVHF